MHPFCFLLITAIKLHTTIQTSPTNDVDSGPNIDLALIIHSGEAYGQILYIIGTIIHGSFPKIFPWTPLGTRVGVVMSIPNGDFTTVTPRQLRPSKWTVVTNLTGDKEEFKTGMIRAASIWCGGCQLYDKSWFDAFKMAEEDLFIEEPGKVQSPRVIVLITATERGSFNDSYEEPLLTGARKMRERGIHMFAINLVKTLDDAQDQLTAIVGDRDNLKYDTDRGEMDEEYLWLKDRITHVLCGRVQRCFFLEPRTKCQKAWFTPNLTSAQGDCANFNNYTITTPMSNDAAESCTIEKCEATCDELWPIAIECTESNCGKEFPRKGLRRWEQLQNCNRNGRCPACGSSSTMTFPATTRARTTTSEPAASPSTTMGVKRAQDETVILAAVMTTMIRGRY